MSILKMLFLSAVGIFEAFFSKHFFALKILSKKTKIIVN